MIYIWYPLRRQKFCQHIFCGFRKAWNFSIRFWNSDQRFKRNIFTSFFFKFKHRAFKNRDLWLLYATNYDFLYMAEAYSEPCQTSKTELFAEIVNAERPLVVFAESSILDIWHGSENVSEWYDVEGYIGLTLVTLPKTFNITY